jgi:hypothetical protein
LLAKIEPPRLEEIPPFVDPLIWYILMRASDRFQSKNGHIPNKKNDFKELKRCLTELITETKV